MKNFKKGDIVMKICDKLLPGDSEVYSTQLPYSKKLIVSEDSGDDYGYETEVVRIEGFSYVHDASCFEKI